MPSTNADKITITFRFEGTIERNPKQPGSWRWDARRYVLTNGTPDDRCIEEHGYADSEEEARAACQWALLAFSDPGVQSVTLQRP